MVVRSDRVIDRIVIQRERSGRVGVFRGILQLKSKALSKEGKPERQERKSQSWGLRIREIIVRLKLEHWHLSKERRFETRA